MYHEIDGRIEIKNTMTCTESAKGSALWVVNTSAQVLDVESEFKRIIQYKTPQVIMPTQEVHYSMSMAH